MRWLFLFLVFLMSRHGSAQNYISFPESNAVWIQGSSLYFAYSGHEHATLTQPLSFGNDTVISGITYHSLHGHTIADWIDGWGNQQTYQTGTDLHPDQVRVFFRQDIPSQRVFQWDTQTGQEQLLYDFSNLVVGQPYPQTLNNLAYPQLLVMAYDSILLNDGLYHERWVLGSGSLDSGFVSVIEGIGSTMGFDLPILLPFEQTSATLCFTIGGNPVYDAWNEINWLIAPRFSSSCSADVSVEETPVPEWQVRVWPNPFSESITLQSSQSIQHIRLLDISGRVVFFQDVKGQEVSEIRFDAISPGTYFLQLYSIGGTLITKKVIQRI